MKTKSFYAVLVSLLCLCLLLVLVSCGGESEITTAEDQTTTASPDESSTSDGDESSVPDGDESSTPDGDESSTPDDNESSTPDGEDSSTPDDDESSVPGGEDSSMPDGDDSSTPDDDGSSTPDDDESSTPDDDGSSTPDDDEDDTPKPDHTEGLSFDLNADGASYAVIGFDNATATEIIIPATYQDLPVTVIADNAFQGCTLIVRIVLPQSITAIGDGAFSGCASLTEITLSAGIKTIGNNAFSGCILLIEIVLPDTVEVLGDGAFAGCTSLTNVTLPDGIKVIGTDAFSGCESLNLTDYENGYYLGNTDTPCLVLVVVIDPTAVTSFAVHADAKIIASYAFADCKRLLEILIPNGVLNIGDHAFENCEELINLVIPDTVKELGENLFAGCESLTEVILPDGSTIAPHTHTYSDKWSYDANNHFHGATCKHTGLKIDVTPHTFDDGVPTTDMTCEQDGAITYTCSGCGYQKVKTINAKEHTYSTVWTTDDAHHWHASMCECSNVSDWGSHTYDGNTCTVCGHQKPSEGLYFIPNSDGASYTVGNIGEATDVHLVIPSSYESYPVTGIAANAFEGNTTLLSLTIPDSIKTIGTYAFYGCTSLQRVTLGNGLQTVADYAFMDCDALEGLYIKDLAAYLSISFGYSYANPLQFANDLYLNGELITDLVIPDGITSIGVRALQGGSFASVTFGKDVTHIGSYAFALCENLAAVNIPNHITRIDDGAFYNCSELKSVTLPDNLKSVPYAIFQKCSALESIEIPSTVKTIEAYAFSGCSSLKNVILPEGVTAINGLAFQSCTALESIHIPNGILSIGDSAFTGCKSLNYAIYDNAKYLGNEENPHLILVSAKSTSITSCNIHEDTKIICDYAFDGCTRLSTVTLPDGIMTVGRYAFNKCSALTYTTYENANYLGNEQNPHLVLLQATSRTIESYIIHENTKVIASLAFYANTGLKSIVIPDRVVYINASAFSNSKLTEVTIGNGVVHIGDRAFDSTQLQKITFGSSLQIIGESAFIATDLTEVVLPETVTSVGMSTFYCCYYLKSVTFSSGMTVINPGTVGANFRLTDVIIPNSITLIDARAFYDCRVLQNIYYIGTEAEWNATVIEPEENEAVLKATVYFYSESEPTDTENQYWHYVEGVPTPW